MLCSQLASDKNVYRYFLIIKIDFHSLGTSKIDSIWPRGVPLWIVPSQQHGPGGWATNDWGPSSLVLEAIVFSLESC